jgi:hypothetical protein
MAELVCHPGSSCPAVQSIQARASFLDARVLSLGFTLKGELDRLNIPGPSAPVRTDGLWEHTCFEAFLAPSLGEDYFELNVSPSSAWAAYCFPRYREGGAPALDLEPRLVVHRRPNRLELHLLVGIDPTLTRSPFRIGFSAVVEQQDGRLSYWALRHPEGRPDFHHPIAFALELAPLPEED